MTSHIEALVIMPWIRCKSTRSICQAEGDLLMSRTLSCRFIISCALPSALYIYESVNQCGLLRLHGTLCEYMYGGSFTQV